MKALIPVSPDPPGTPPTLSVSGIVPHRMWSERPTKMNVLLRRILLAVIAAGAATTLAAAPAVASIATPAAPPVAAPAQPATMTMTMTTGR